MGAEPLVLNGFISSEYIHLMIKNVEENGPYCVLRKGLALAHAQSDKSVFSTGMSLLVLNDGVEFGHEENDPVHLLFCFCVNDSRDYLKALKNLIALSNERNFLSEMCTAKNSNFAHKILKRRELGLCNLSEAAI
jgi:mannitol/fructose-specific phosphotransferase system IIA component (Ntr-type)